MSTKIAMKKTSRNVALETIEPQVKTPAHLWTNGGDEVFVLRFVNKDGQSYQGFQHPLTVGETVTAPDWNTRNACGGGIHGWAWGIGIGDGKEPEDGIVGNLEGEIKCKFRTGGLRFVGDWYGAMMFILDGQKKWAEHYSEGEGHATGYSSASSAPGKASAAVVTGHEGRAQAGEYGCIALALWNDKEQRYEMRCAEIGCGDGSDGKLKAGIWYQLNDGGKFVEV